MSEEFKGKMKEAAGAITGDEDLKAEGRACREKPKRRRKPSRGRRLGRPRPRPSRPRRSEKSKSSRTRACWATWATRYPNSR